MNRLARFLVGAVITFLLSCVILWIAARAELLAGAHLYSANLMLKWSVVVALLAGIVAAALPQPPLRAWLLASTGIALACALMYTAIRYYSFHYTGKWKWGLLSLDVELQMTLCWAAAIVSAFLISNKRWLPTAIIALPLFIAAIFLPAPAYNYIMHEQALTVAFVVPDEHSPVTSPPRIYPSLVDQAAVTAQVQSALRRSGISGDYRLANIYRSGKGKPSMQVVVIEKPVTSVSFLPQPSGTTAVYVQRGERWDRIPGDARVLDRSVRISKPTAQNDALAYFEIPDARGISLLGIVRQD